MAIQKLEFCNFCGKSHKHVNVLIAGDDIAICDGCISISQDLVKKKLEEKTSPSVWDKLSPKSIHSMLDQYIIGQNVAKRTLAVAVHNHIKRINSNRLNQDVEISKSNILLMGPTGSGKTLLAQTLAKILQLPIAIGDATTLTEAGYVGEDVENLISRVYQAANGDVQQTQKGIVYVDEIDKIARKSEGMSLGRDVSGEGVQQALLKLVEGSEVYIPTSGGKKTVQTETVLINTKDILFICGGAFVGLTSIIQKRLSKNSGMGFVRKTSAKKTDEEDYNLLGQVTEKDIKKFGIIPELVGRLPIVVSLQKLSEEQLVNILTEPKNALVKQYIRLFQENGVELTFTKDALYSIAAYANAIDLGARALRRLLESILLEPMYEAGDLPGKKFEVTQKIVENGLDSFREPEIPAEEAPLKLATA